MPKYRLTLAYDGTDFHGWQVQSEGSTVQGTLEAVFERCFHTPLRVIGAGRTDTGVHAAGQVAHVTLPEPMEPTALQRMLNGNLPPTIRIHNVERVEESFHAQISAKRKIYHYHLWLEGPLDPLLRHYRTHLPYSICVERLKKAAALFVGTHDFTTFANVGTKTKSAVRTLLRLDIVPQQGGIRLEFEGTGFLYKMVRNITGTLLEVASGKRPLEDIPRLLDAKDRRRAGVAAPPQGLIMVSVAYDDA